MMVGERGEVFLLGWPSNRSPSNRSRQFADHALVVKLVDTQS
jgi:hypothetical protein